MDHDSYAGLESLDVRQPIWERIFTVAPLVLVGTVDPDGTPDLAPKHMAFPLGWDNFFGFVCAPSHSTHRNAERTRTFTVSYPRPQDIVSASLTASPRCEDAKPIVGLLDTFAAQKVSGPLVRDSNLFLECELIQIIEGFGRNHLIAGRVVAAYAPRDALRGSDRDDADLLLARPQLAYLYPGRFATIAETLAFPFPAGMRR
jgi:flavin reductase (DIM6/NTAB) family NADH-FMN oxidoreductase RutF